MSTSTPLLCRKWGTNPHRWADLPALAASSPAAENRGVQAGLPQTSQRGGRLFIRLSARKRAAGFALHWPSQAPLAGFIGWLGSQSQTGSPVVGWNSAQATSSILEVIATANITLSRWASRSSQIPDSICSVRCLGFFNHPGPSLPTVSLKKGRGCPTTFRTAPQAKRNFPFDYVNRSGLSCALIPRELEVQPLSAPARPQTPSP